MLPLPTLSRSKFEMRQMSLATCLALAMGLAGAAPTASAAPSGSTLVVANCNDSGVGSLRDAVGLAVSGDTVDMSQLGCNSITLGSEIVSTVDDLTLKGAPTSNFGAPAISAGAGNTDGLLRHTGQGLLTIENLTLVGGQRVGPGSRYGGCVRSAGSVHMFESAAEDCTTEGTSGEVRGGAIYAADDVYLSGSLVEGNVAELPYGFATGGGVYAGRNLFCLYSAIRNNTAVAVSGVASSGGGARADGGTIDGCTISGNEAEFGGGLILESTTQPVKIENSTISGNSSTRIQAQTAAAVLISVSNNPVVLENNTITANVSYSEFGAGMTIRQAPSSTVLTSNIISGNRYFLGEVNGEPTYAPSDLSHTSGVTITGSHNLVGHVESNVVLPADTIRQEQAPFEPLDAGGGFMGTHAIGTGSWAFNLGTTVDNGAGDPPETLDQNGNDRTVGTGVDIGAVESDALFIGRFEDPPTF